MTFNSIIPRFNRSVKDDVVEATKYALSGYRTYDGKKVAVITEEEAEQLYLTEPLNVGGLFIVPHQDGTLTAINNIFRWSEAPFNKLGAALIWLTTETDIPGAKKLYKAISRSNSIMKELRNRA